MRSNILSQFSNIQHYITTKPKSFRCPFYNGSDTKISEKNKILLADELKITEEKIIFLNQTHSTDIVLVDETNYSDEIYADAALSSTQWIMLSVLTSDCLPLLIYDEKNHSIWVIHAGWKGLLWNILPQTITKMQEIFSSHVDDIYVFIGPSISQKNYEIWEDVKQQIPEKYNICVEDSEKQGKYFLDLKTMAELQLQEVWIKKENIEISPYCTYNEKQLFHSYRRKTHLWDSDYGNNAFWICLT